MRWAMVVLASLICAATLGGEPIVAASPTTTHNDDSCDISVLPAATLLLPYFEVDVEHPANSAETTTIFTVTNVSRLPQIARVTLWTDYAYPVLTFNLFLTGYDAQAINLRDVLVRGVIGAPNGTSSAMVPGPLSVGNSSNRNFALDAVNDCEHLPGIIPASLVKDLRAELTNGASASCSGGRRVGAPHERAIGYATIDVVATCGTRGPAEADYYRKDLLFDNVLMGDYQQIDANPTIGNYAGGSPLIHIRAIPEGGAPGSLAGTNLPYTFYDRLTPHGTRALDRRQPLPSTFAARFIQGGTGNFNTNIKIWREGLTRGSETNCATAVINRDGPVGDVVRFDEHENPTEYNPGCAFICVPFALTLPALSSLQAISSYFPELSTSGDVAGWIYLDLNNGGSSAYSVAGGRDTSRYLQTNGPRQSQNWVIISTFAEGRYAVDFDAVAMGNGCSPPPDQSLVIFPVSPRNRSTNPIGPLPDANP